MPSKSSVVASVFAMGLMASAACGETWTAMEGRCYEWQGPWEVNPLGANAWSGRMNYRHAGGACSAASGDQFTASVRVKINDHVWTAERTGSSDGNDCNYVGKVQGEQLLGQYYCTKNGGPYYIVIYRTAAAAPSPESAPSSPPPPTPATPTRKSTFTDPMIDGHYVDRCFAWAEQCDEPAASAFCRSQGLSRATAWHWVYRAPTVVQSTGQICNDPKGCGGFDSIECE